MVLVVVSSWLNLTMAHIPDCALCLQSQRALEVQQGLADTDSVLAISWTLSSALLLLLAPRECSIRARWWCSG